MESSSSLCILLRLVADGNTFRVFCLAFKWLLKTWLHGDFSCSLDISRMFSDSINVSPLRPQKEDFIKSLELVKHPELPSYWSGMQSPANRLLTAPLSQCHTGRLQVQLQQLQVTLLIITHLQGRHKALFGCFNVFT